MCAKEAHGNLSRREYHKNALHALREKLSSKYPITCPANSEIISVTDQPAWISPAVMTRLQKKETIDLGVKMNNASIEVDTDVTSERWQEFITGEHTATLTGNRLIIRKV